ncbi:enterobactin synthetase component F (plasmid) [Azospirillum sp. B510]|uniref:non-ribosomal peptide synthetase n=1 Tax=Azospirillum sp. (strain B510) TaxID=137722 RepID=UPI0001C4CFE2|nr:non-ribosomal peptide synthetase [Azospirillum sp. B510]BAI74310.1 enterobactin synthetase component F [Azospirillum sp. B510]
MSLEELLSSLDRQGIRLSARDGRLVVDAPAGSLTEELRGQLAARKGDLLTLLDRRDDVAAPAGGMADGMADGTIPRLRQRSGIPASPAQRRLWLLQTLDPEDSRYNVNLLLELSGRIDAAAIARSLDALAERHEILRSVAREDAGEVVIDLLDRIAVPLEDRNATPGEADALIEAAMARPFAMRPAGQPAGQPDDGPPEPLLRALLLRTGPDRARLLLTFHHMVVDEESLKILARDWSRLYRHPEEATATPVVQHADAADWLRRRLDGAARDRLLAHWSEALGGEQPALTLPADPAADPTAGEHAGARIDRRLPRATVERIGRLCAERRLTPYVLLLAAYQWTLSRWSGQRDLRVATPVSERSHPALEGVVGPMINTLVMRALVTPGMTGAELLDRTRRTVLDGQRHGGLPFELLVDHLRPARDLQGEPLAQTMFNYLRGGERATLELGDLTATALPVPERSAKFDLSLFVTAPAGSITLSLQYRTARFAAATVERFADHLLHVLDALLSATDQPLDRLAALPASDLSRQRGWNATAVEYGGFVPLGRLLSEQAARSPDAVALQWEEAGHGANPGDRLTARLTYADLDRRANRLAHWLIAAGCRPDDRVALCLERSPELVVAILAALKAGCAWLPLDPEHPPQRLAAMVADGGARLILAHQRTRDRLPPDLPPDGCGVPVHPLDPAVSLAAGFPDRLPDRPVDPAQLAYALFTSGSTGRPKAVGVPQAGLLNRLRWMQDRYRLSPADTVLQKTPYGFDVSVWEFLWPLLTGARLVLAGPGEHRDARRLSELIEGHGVTTLHFVPAMLQVFLDALPDGRCPTLARVLCSGEALPAALRDRCTAALPQAELHNLYGPTEASIDVTAWDCRSETGPSVPIGHPIANIRAWVLDDALNPVPAGVAGELYLTGVGLARGYLGRPDLTAAAFLPNPLYDPAGDGPDQQRLYRTGDLARHRPDGAIDYLGRADFQVKIRGQRVELGEIEAALAALPQVAEAVVAACGDKRADGQAGGALWLTAWLTARPGQSLPDPDALRAALADRLPDHMVPAVFVPLDRMPINQNGKIDRKALPQPEPPQCGGGEARNEAEGILTALWRKLLRVDGVGIHDNFFVLGGDSIISLQLSAQARLQGLHFEPRAVFRHQTIAALAAHAGREPVSVRADTVPATGPTPLTGIQRWFFDSFDDGDTSVPDHANQAVLLASDTAIDEDALRRALAGLLADHPMLSARFHRDGAGTGGWVQEIPATPAPLSLRAATIAESDPERRLAAIDALVAATQASLSLADGRLIAAGLIRLGGDGDRLLLAIHHLAVDGVSWRILLDDLAAGYAAALAGRGVPHRPSSVSFRQWALEEETRRTALAAGPRLEDEVAARPGGLPFDRPLPAEGCRVRNQRRHSVTLPAEQARHLVQSAPAAFRAGPEALCLTALARTLQRWRMRRGVAPAPLTLFVEGHGRDLLPLDSSRTVGWFTRLQPLRLPVEADQPLAAALLATRAALAGTMAGTSGSPDSDIPYLLRRDRSDDAAASATGLLFNFLGHVQERAGAFRRAPEPLGHFRAPGNRLPFAIEVNASMGTAGLTVSWQTAGEVLDAATVDALAADMMAELHALAALCADPGEGGALISDFPLADLAPGDLDRIAKRHPLGRVEDILRLSPMQRGMLLHSLGGDTNDGGGHYVSQTVVRCEGALDADLLQQACQRTIDRHPALRTGFLLDGTARQIVLRRARFALRWESLLDADGTEQAEAMERIRREDRAALALDRPPLLRCSVLRLAPRGFRIVWTIHHLVMDGWSLPILTGEVLRHYDALRRGLEAADLPAPVPYRDFIAWLGQRDAEADARFWREELAGFPGATPLPGAWTRGGLGYHTEEHRMEEAEQGAEDRNGAALRRLCGDRRLTLNSVIQGLWGLVLARHAGAAEVTVGVTLAGRPADLPGAERCLGTFINTVPLRLRPQAEQTLSAFLEQVQEKGALLAGHGHAPLAAIRGWAGNPDSLFDSILVSEALPPGEAAGTAGLVLTRETTEVRNSYPLTLRIVPGAMPRFDLLIDHDRIDPAVPRRMLADLLRLLAGLPELIDQPLGALYRRLAPADAGMPPVAEADCALSRLLSQPGAAIALDEAGERTDYATLAAAAGRIAARLKAAGGEVGGESGGVVAIVLPRTRPHIEAMIASWWLGAAWVALDPALPPARLGWMAADSGATVAAGEGGRPDWLPPSVAWIDLGAPPPMQTPPPAPVRGLPDRVAYLLYTSGSTGQPKGVAVTHGNLVGYVDGVMPHLDLPAGASLATLATVSADLGLTSVFGALLTGRRLSLVPPELAFDPPGLARHLATHPVDALKIVPGHLLALLAVEDPARILPRRCLILGGESLPPAALDRLRRLAPALRIVNHYGPTETTIGAAAGPLDGDSDGDGDHMTLPAQLPVGRPLDGARAYVLDGDLEPVAGGAVGELHIGGLGVSRGYHRRAGLTAERFLPDPWLPGRRMYRTGDLVRRDGDGRLVILGRSDDQVKIRGFRVEPGELRQILAGLPGVEDAAVLVVQGPAGARLGALAVAPRQPAGALLDALSRLVPDQLMPAELRCVAALPLTANGKLDKQAAARLLAEPAGSAATQEPPSAGDDRLERLTALWADILGRDGCGPDDHFFGLGGDSILCLRLIARASAVGIPLTARLVFENPTPAQLAAALAPSAPARSPDAAAAGQPDTASTASSVAGLLRPLWAELLHKEVIADDDHFFRAGGDSITALRLIAMAARQNLRLTARDLFEHPVFADLVRHLDPPRAGALSAPANPPRTESRTTEATLAPIQHWFLEMPQPHPDHWNQAVMLALPERPDGLEGTALAAALGTAVAALAASQPMLRARLDRSGDTPRLTIADGADPRIFATVACADEAAEREAVAAAHGGLSLRDGPLFRVVLLVPPAGSTRESRLLLVAHHLVVDGVSWRIIAAELRSAFTTAARGGRPALPAPMPFGDWSAALAAQPGDRLEPSRRYWAALAASPAWGELVRGADPGTLAGLRKVELTLDTKRAAALARLPEGIEATLLGALVRALAEWQNRSDLVIELEGHGREPEAFGDGPLAALDPSRTVGWFTSRYPVHLRDDPSLADGELRASIRRQLDAVPGRGLGYGLLRYLHRDRDLPPHPQLVFNYLGQVRSEIGGDAGAIAEGWRLLPDAAGQARHPDSRRRQLIEVTAQLRDGELHLVWSYPGRLPQGPFVKATADRVLDLLDGMAAAAVTEEPAAGARAQTGGMAAHAPERLPLTPLQQGMLWHTLAAPGEGVYVNQTAVRIDGPLDITAFTAAWEDTVAAEAILRTGFHAGGAEGPEQFILPAATMPWRLEDWSGRGEAEARSGLHRLMTDDRAAGFRLDDPPLMRLHILRFADDRHWLLWSRHHLIVDAWSTGLLIGDVFHRYRNRLGDGRPAPVPRPPFATYVSWLAGRDAAADDAFWRAELADAAPLPAFPAGPKDAGFELADHRLPDDIAAAARALAREAGVTLNSVVQAAWALALGHRTGRSDILFGMTTAGRPPALAGSDRILGPFINTVPVRIRLDPADGVWTLLDRVQRQGLTVREHEHTPLADIQRCAGLQRGDSLFQSLLVFENESMGEAVELGAGLRLAPLSGHERTNYPLTVTVLPRNGLTLRVAHDGRRIAGHALSALLTEFAGMLGAMAEDGRRPIGTLPRDRSLFAGGLDQGPPVAAEPGWWVGSAILARADAAPDAVAVETAAGPLSYGTLARSANAVARGLRKRGIGPEQRVAIALERGPDLLPSILGVLLAGAAYVPLDPAQPRSRIADILDQADASLLIAPSDAAIATTAIATATPDALIQDGDTAGDEDGGNAPPPCPHPDQAAYVIFTSGSTGRPKGVTVRHAGLSNLLRAMAARLPLTPSDRWLAVTTVGFDIAALELFAPLIAGAAIVLAPEAAQRDPAALLRLAERHGTGVLQATPASWAMLAERDSPAWTGLRALTGGEALPAALARRLLARGVSLINVYGPTETTIWSTATSVDGALDDTAPAVPIGGPLDNTGLHVLDGALNPLPPGAEGELWIGGDGLARGYHRRPGLTAAAFLPDPFATTPGARMYRTGDLVRRRADGALDFLGRGDFQVKLRGHRIELGDIEAALLAQPGVAAAVVRLWDGGPGGGPDAAFLAAYAAGPANAPDNRLDGDRLRAALAERLPAAMVPAVVTVLPALPLNPNGKIDRNALPRPSKPRAATHAPPQGDTELWLAGIWKTILGIEAASEAIGRDDDFFALGGNSLSATRLVAAIRDRLELPAPFTLPFLHPVLKDMAAELQAAGRRDGETLVTLQAGRPEAAPPLFLFHPAGGHVRSYVPLVQFLAADVTVHGLQSPQLADPAVQPGSIDQLADLYTDLIRRRQPDGPYRLFGWSFGGWLATAVAARLEASGALVEWVGVVDARTDLLRGRLDLPDLPLATPFIACLDGATQRRLLEAHRPACGELERELATLPEAARGERALDWLRATMPAAMDRPRDLQALQMRLFMDCHRLMGDFALPRLTAPLHVWWADQTLSDAPFRKGADPNEWARVGQTTVQVVEGDHQSILRARALVQALQALLNRSKAAGSHSA